MSVILEELVQPASMFMIAALILGALFDRVPPGRSREAATGLVCGLAAALVIAMSPVGAGFGDGHGPLVLVGAFVGGVPGFAAVLVPPLAAMLLEARPGLVGAVAGLGVLGLIGLAANLARTKRGLPLRRRTVLWLALASVLAFATLPFASADAASPLGFWLPFGTLLFGLAVVTEHKRCEEQSARASEVRFRELTDTISLPLFKSQLEQHFRMHVRYGQDYSYMLVSIDGAVELRKSLSSAEWELLRATTGVAVRRAVRDPDVCAAVDFDRFAVILPHASLPFALPVAERIQRAVVSATATIGPVTVSVGVAEVDGTIAAHDIEAAAEAELFLANMRQKTAAIGPWMDWPAARPMLSFPDRPGVVPATGERRRARPTRLVALADAPPLAHDREDA